MNKKKYYFIAIGGAGMSGLAKYLTEKGCKVSGSDICNSKYVQELKKMGVAVHIGHNADNVPEGSVVVTSTAIRDDNPEIIRAKELGLQIYHRSDLLAEISREGKFFLGYSGTHGKTTTSGLSSYVMEKAGLKPSFVVGGIIPEIGTNSCCQDGKYFTAELDESDGTIVKYVPNVCVINNLEADHLDFYKNGLASILETFEKFISKMPNDSVVLVNNDCEASGCLNGHKTMTFGLFDGADYIAKNINFQEDFTTFDVYFKGELLTDIKIILKGKHNVYNSLAAAASLHQAGIDLSLVKPYFAEFTGMGRRFQKAGSFRGISLYDDYAHHPTEIKATLSAASNFRDKNIIAVFQPHRYSRLKNLWDEFLDAFDGAARVVVTDVYAASEDEIEGVNSQRFVDDLAKRISVPCEYISGNMQEVAKKLLPTLKSGDILIGLGAGTINALGKELLNLNSEVVEVGC